MTRPQCCTEVPVKKIVDVVSVWPELAFRGAKKIFTLERRAVGVSFFFWNHSFSCKSWLEVFWRCRAQLFLLTHSCPAHPLDLDPSYNSSCSSDVPLPRPPSGSFKKMPRLFCCDGLPAVMQEFPTLACLFALPPLPPSFTSLYLAMWCAQKSTIQSHPPPPPPCLSSISLFKILCLASPAAQSGAIKRQIQVRHTGRHQT